MKRFSIFVLYLLTTPLFAQTTQLSLDSEVQIIKAKEQATLLSLPNQQAHYQLQLKFRTGKGELFFPVFELFNQTGRSLGLADNQNLKISKKSNKYNVVTAKLVTPPNAAQVKITFPESLKGKKVYVHKNKKTMPIRKSNGEFFITTKANKIDQEYQLTSEADVTATVINYDLQTLALEANNSYLEFGYLPGVKNPTSYDYSVHAIKDIGSGAYVLFGRNINSPLGTTFNFPVGVGFRVTPTTFSSREYDYRSYGVLIRAAAEYNASLFRVGAGLQVDAFSRIIVSEIYGSASEHKEHINTAFSPYAYVKLKLADTLEVSVNYIQSSYDVIGYFSDIEGSQVSMAVSIHF